MAIVINTITPDITIAPYLVSMFLLSIAFGYDLAFTEATKRLGRSLVDSQEGRGVQDALTPPWATGFGLTTYGLCIGGVAYGWYSYGGVLAISVAIGLFFAVRLNQRFLPKPKGDHFRRLIVRSLLNRYANYERHGDNIRAAAVGALLEKLGLPTPKEVFSD